MDKQTQYTMYDCRREVDFFFSSPCQRIVRHPARRRLALHLQRPFSTVVSFHQRHHPPATKSHSLVHQHQMRD